MNDETTSTAPEAGEQAPETTSETVETPADQRPEVPMIPKPRFDELNAKLKEAVAAQKELEALKQAQADDAAAKANDIEKFKTERDQFKGEAEQWRSYAQSKLDALAEGLDDAGQAILEDLGDDVPLSKRLAIAEKLASGKKPAAAFGTTGGKSGNEPGVIPSAVQTKQDFHNWWSNLLTTPDGRAKAADPEFNRRVTAERVRRFG